MEAQKTDDAMPPNPANAAAIAVAADTNDSLLPLSKTDEPELIQLFNPFKVRRGTTVRIISTAPIKLEFLDDWEYKILPPNISVTLNPSDDETMLSPLLEPRPVFARGWKKLPDELKVQILTFNLGAPVSISANDFNFWGFDFPKSISFDNVCACDYVDNLERCLRITPEIADLSREIFWGVNTFEIHIKHRKWIYYPPHAAHGYIRHIHVKADISLDTRWLQHISNLGVKMKKLKTMKITIMWDLNGSCCMSTMDRKVVNRMKDNIGKPHVFNCAGSIEFEYTGDKLLQQDTIVQVERVQAEIKEVEVMLRTKFPFKNST